MLTFVIMMVVIAAWKMPLLAYVVNANATPLKYRFHLMNVPPYQAQLLFKLYHPQHKIRLQLLLPLQFSMKNICEKEPYLLTG